MSWTLSTVGKDAEEAKAKLRESNKMQGNPCPDAVLQLVDDAVAALPDCKIEGYDAVAVSTYGHLHDDPDSNGTSNVNLSVQHVNSDGLSKAAA